MWEWGCYANGGGGRRGGEGGGGRSRDLLGFSTQMTMNEALIVIITCVYMMPYLRHAPSLTPTTTTPETA